MKTPTLRRAGRPGFVSYVMVLATGGILTALTIYAYRGAMAGQQVQAKVQLHTDYAEKEDAVLRAIVAITPNRAIRAMQHNSNSSSSIRDPLRWQNIFTESLNLANARTSIPAEIQNSIGITGLRTSNTGDGALGTPSRIFRAVSPESGFASSGLNRNLGEGFPVPLQSGNTTTVDRDKLYPIISNDKVHGTLSAGGVALPPSQYPDYNIYEYPQINFGYVRPGEPFVAKRNWWAFRVNMSNHDRTITGAVNKNRHFVLSIYEVPSQLAISAGAFMSLGRFSNGENWGNVTIDGGVFAGRAVVDQDTALSALSSRRGMSLASNATVGGQSFVNNPFAPGVRESYHLTQGDFFPVSLSSESGRVAFVPINRGVDYFDRFSHTAESTTVSLTTWNNYSVGALQCAMRLDITAVASPTNPTPTALRFSYLRNGARQTMNIPLNNGIESGLPPGYIYACNENQSYNFGDTVVDVAYGKNGVYAYQNGVTGNVTFNNARFGDPLVGVFKAGYYRPSYPFEVRQLQSGQIAIAVYPKRLKDFLWLLRADGITVNHSLVVNVDYSNTGLNNPAYKPAIPCTNLDYGLVIEECDDLTDFTRGFSLVTNLRAYFGDDFNIIPTTPPAGYTPEGDYYPPVSLFAPEKRYGVDIDPYAVDFGGQVGSLAGDSVATPIRPLDSRNRSGQLIESERVTVNLRPIRHPAELPPVTMVNWLVVLSERRSEHLLIDTYD